MASWFYDAMHEDPEFQRLEALKEAVRPLIEGLKGRPKSEWYFLRLDHPAIEKLYQAFKETEDE